VRDGRDLDGARHQSTQQEEMNRTTRLIRVATAAVMVTGCASFSKGFHGQKSFPLMVTNKTDFEVVVYAVPATGGDGVRLGNAGSFANTTLAVPRSALQANDVLQVRVRSIGAARRARPFLSPPVQLDSTRVAMLEVHSDAAGDLSTSALVTDFPPARPPQ
jgi:hypothetical protein